MRYNDDRPDFQDGFDDFEDIFSSAAEDEFEDIYSDQTPDPDPVDEPFFEDIFSGAVEDREEDAPFLTDFFGDDEAEPVETPVRAPGRVNTTPEKKPYSYHYDDENAPRRARNGDEIYSNENPKAPKKKRKKKHIGLKIFAVLLVLVLLFVGGVGYYGYSRVQKMLDAVNCVPLQPNTFIGADELAHSDDVKNILLIGVDARSGESAEKTRSDTMMLVSIDSKNGQIKLTSFLRDTYIEIPGYRYDKLNAAQSHGGTQLLIDTLEYNYKIDIDNYMLVNFSMFTTIVDRLGGVDVEVTEKEAKYINSGHKMTDLEKAAFKDGITAGESVHLDGTQALWYSRIRYLDSDFMRTKRQRKVISAIVDKARAQKPLELLDMIEEVMPMIQTDLKSEEMMALGMNALTYLQYDIAQQQIPAAHTWKDGKRRGQSVLLIDLEKNQTIVHDFVFEKAEIEEPTTEKSK